jgi:hypothetical protein
MKLKAGELTVDAIQLDEAVAIVDVPIAVVVGEHIGRFKKDEKRQQTSRPLMGSFDGRKPQGNSRRGGGNLETGRIIPVSAGETIFP